MAKPWKLCIITLKCSLSTPTCHLGQYFFSPLPLIYLTLCRPLHTEMLTMTHWLCDIRIDLCVGSGVLQRLNTTHAAQMTFRTCASKDSVGYRFHPEMSMLTDTRCWSSRLLPSCGISHKSAAPWLLIWKHGGAHPITVMIGIRGSTVLLVIKHFLVQVFIFPYFRKWLKCTQIHKQWPKTTDHLLS